VLDRVIVQVGSDQDVQRLDDSLDKKQVSRLHVRT